MCETALGSKARSGMYTVLVDRWQYGMDSRALLGSWGKARIQARPLWQPMHASPAHADIKHSACPVASGCIARR